MVIGGRLYGRTIPIGMLSSALLVLIVWNLARALPTPILFDFGSFVASGRAAAQGLDPYGIYPPLTFRVVLPGFETWNPNLNPPALLPLFQLFGWFDPHQAFRIWWSVSFAAYVAVLALLASHYMRKSWLLPVMWALALAGFWDTLVLGQIYTPLVLCAVAGWLLLDRGHSMLAGLAIGVVVAAKPNFAAWPLLLLAAGHMAPAAAALSTAALLSLVPVGLYGPEVYRQWFEVIADDAGRALFLTNASLPGILARAGLKPLAAVAAFAVMAALGAWVLRRRSDALQASALGLIGALVSSPLAWVHYTLFLLPIFFFLGPRNGWILAAALLLLIPVPAVLELSDMSAPLQVTIGSVYGWAVLLCLAGTVASIKEKPQPGQAGGLPRSLTPAS
jgi:hypothetical protein